MAVCKCCGKKLGVLTGSNRMAFEYEEPICDKCFYKFKASCVTLENAKDEAEVAEAFRNVSRIVEQAGFTNEGTAYVLDYLKWFEDKQYQRLNNTVEKRKERKIEKEKEWQEILSKHLRTTGYDFNGYDILSYQGIVSGSTVIGTGFLAEADSEISDFFGTTSSILSDKIQKARQIAIEYMVKKSLELGGNAIIGVHFDHISFTKNNMIGVVVNGTSVVVVSK